ncbi:F-actin-capping protein subunit beta [Coemansia erecta]|nr:F-actin-capping protein subunit beta [Coemansia erecta]
MTNTNDLQSLLKRIEKATARLEDLAAKRSETTKPDEPSKASTDASVDVEDSKAALEYERAIKPLVEHFVSCSAKIGGLVSDQAQFVQQLYTAQHDFVRLAGTCKQPSPSQLPTLLGAQQSAIQSACALKDANRPSEYFDNLSAVAEGVAAFGWVAVAPTPVPFVNDMKESAEFYTNRVLRKWRESDPNQVEWVKALLSIFRELAVYVKQFHTTGLVWNPKGGDAEAAAKALGNADSVPVSTPPAPQLPSATQDEPKASSAGGSTRGALFADLNRGGGVTTGLRKVDTTQMTHKNPSLRAAGTVSGDSTTAPAAPAAPAAPKAKAPRMELQKDKWVVENYDSENLSIEATATWQTVYMYNCTNTTLIISGKLNSVAIDNCQKCGIVFDSLVSQCEIVNSKRVQVQARETVPSILVDRTDGAHLFLSEAARDATQITTAKASEVNVSFPFETANPEDDDTVEQPVPEQLQTVVKNGKLVTTVLEHTG